MRINRINNAKIFVESWDDPCHANNTRKIALKYTAAGNINSTGQAGNPIGELASRWQEEFYDALEPGVKDLVITLIQRFGWITYSSCEGHRYNDTAIKPDPRKVGLLPRSPSELHDILSVLGQAAEMVNRDKAPQSIALRVIEERLDSEVGESPSVELRFSKVAESSWDDYFEQLQTTYSSLLMALKTLSYNHT